MYSKYSLQELKELSVELTAEIRRREFEQDKGKMADYKELIQTEAKKRSDFRLLDGINMLRVFFPDMSLRSQQTMVEEWLIEIGKR